MECANCGRHNQPTTRFCAECGDVLRVDPPRQRRSRSRKNSRRLRRRIHWVRVPPAPPPSILTAKMQRLAPADAAPARMMRRVDLAFAALVGVAGIVAYVAYPYLKGERAQEAPVAAALAAPALAPVAIPRMDSPPPVEARLAPLALPIAPPLGPSRALDVVPPRSHPTRAKSDAASRAAERAAAEQRPSYAVTTAYSGEPLGPPVAPPPRVAAVTPAPAPARKDRLQVMNEAMAACAGEGFLGRVVCEQRALLAYCDGQWGQNERCPSGRRTDYGN